MRLKRFSPSIAAGAAGFLAGVLYHKFPLQRQFLVSSANPVELDVGEIIAADIEKHAIEFVPIMKYGFPGYDTLRFSQHFVLSYDRRNKVPNWVMEHLTPDMIDEDGKSCVSRKNSKFFQDTSIHEFFRASLKDYKNSGYDRGHLAAAANYKYSQKPLNNTFVLSNITPQDHHFNKVTWFALENHVRELLKGYRSVYVCSGPLYLPRVIDTDEEKIIQLLEDDEPKNKKRKKDKSPKTKKVVIYEVIGENNVAVPTHFFKIILCEDAEGYYDIEAYVIPNQRLDTGTPLENYMVPRDAIEKAAGFLLFHHIPLSGFRSINREIQKSDKEEYMDDS